MRRVFFIAVWTLLCSGDMAGAWADVILLKSGGRLYGELVNKDENPRVNYVVKTNAGGEVTLDKATVKSVRPESESEKEYIQVRGKYDDTVTGQMELAEWCRQHGMESHRRIHLARVLDFEPENPQARQSLGFRKVHGEWMTRDEEMIQQGKVFYKGKWITPQVKEIEEERHAFDVQTSGYYAKLKMWVKWFGTDRETQALANIDGLRDPAAVPALRDFLTGKGSHGGRYNPDDRDQKLHIVKTLARIGNDTALQTLLAPAVDDDYEEVRSACLSALKETDYKGAVTFFIGRFKNNNNPESVNIVGAALGVMKSSAAIEPLINHLVTKTKVQVNPTDPNRIQSTFGGGPGMSGGGNFSFGAPPPIFEEKSTENPDVLRALVGTVEAEYHANVNFNYDAPAWKHWYAQQRRPKGNIDTRRD
jgi:hypothetical protein